MVKFLLEGVVLNNKTFQDGLHNLILISLFWNMQLPNNVDLLKQSYLSLQSFPHIFLSFDLHFDLPILLLLHFHFSLYLQQLKTITLLFWISSILDYFLITFVLDLVNHFYISFNNSEELCRDTVIFTVHLALLNILQLLLKFFPQDMTLILIFLFYGFILQYFPFQQIIFFSIYMLLICNYYIATFAFLMNFIQLPYFHFILLTICQKLLFGDIDHIHFPPHFCQRLLQQYFLHLYLIILLLNSYILHNSLFLSPHLPNPKYT